MKNTTPKVIDLAEASRLLGTHHNRVRRVINDGLLAAVPVGAGYEITREAITRCQEFRSATPEYLVNHLDELEVTWDQQAWGWLIRRPAVPA